ncbi:MAG: tetratricopeptide repeat protein [Deltaproteobacteria bacterium]|nr:tetratricopeptide repeat protein [Deltaproteobacteria bacterium]
MDETEKLRDDPAMLMEESVYRRMLEKDPTSRVFSELANLFWTQDRFDEVISVLERGVELYPDDLAARRLLSKAYLKTGRMLEAMAELEKVAVRLDNLASIYLDLGQIYYHQRDMGKAMAAARIFSSHHPENDLGQELLARLTPDLATESPEPAVPHQQAATQTGEAEETEVSPPVPAPFLTKTLAELFRQQGHHEKAAEIYQKLSLLPPDEPQRIRAAGEPSPGPTDLRHLQKKKAINIMEKWLGKIRHSSSTQEVSV